MPTVPWLFRSAPSANEVNVNESAATPLAVTDAVAGPAPGATLTTVNVSAYFRYSCAA